jgi:hypothetical protein
VPGRSAIGVFQRRDFMHRDMIGLRAFDFVLRIILGAAVRMPFVSNPRPANRSSTSR